MKKTAYPLGLIVIFLICLTTNLVIAQNSSSDDLNEDVAAATNPAGQVPDEIPDDDASFAKGRSLFGQHCSACHALGKQIIGPALASVHNRRPLDWLVSFIQNSQDVIEAAEPGDYAKVLFEQYDRQVMPNYEFLSREDILDIMAYIKVESVSTTSGVSGYMSDQTESVQEQAMSEDGLFSQKGDLDNEGYNMAFIMGGLVVGIILVVVILVALRRRTKQNA